MRSVLRTRGFRIMAVGWNRHVVEFEDTGTSSTGKSWEVRHTDDVLASAARAPLSIATSTYNSELILWKLETGQPYRRFSCTDPMLRIKMQYNKREGKPPTGAGSSGARRSSQKRRSTMQGRESISASQAMAKARARRVSSVSLPARAQHMRQLACHAMIFLTTRPMAMGVASLLVSLENGTVQCWSDHPAGGFQGSFQGVHTAGDYVSAFATDVNNDYLFTGTTMGYVKVWLMTNFLIGDEEKKHVSMPRLRLEFPFLWRDRVQGRAKRSVRDQPLPLLLNSYRAHLRCITTVAYVDEFKLVFSGSSDYSVRVWRLSGEYLATLGGLAPWTLEVTGRLPPDVKKVASSTTLKVWRGGQVSRYTPGQVEVDQLRDITPAELRHKTFGAPPAEPLLGRHLVLPRRPERQEAPALDCSLQTVPLYAHLRMAATVPVRRPPTPPLVLATRLRHASTRRTHFEGPPSAAPAPAPHAPQHNKDKEKDNV